MYTALDFLKDDVPNSKIRLGWKVEITKTGLISLSYNALNFDWNSLNDICDESVNAFLQCENYKRLKKRLDKARERFGGRTYFEATGIEVLKELVERHGVKADIDKMVSAAIKRKSAMISKKSKKRMRLTREMFL